MQFAPIFIFTGEARDQGFGDVLLRALAAKLPQYQHRLVVAPLERALERTRDGRELICVAFLLRTPERETLMRFSDPILKVPPNGVVIRASDQSRFEPFMQNGRLSLTHVLQTRTFATGITRNRSYGSGVNALLALYAGQPMVVERSGQGASAATLSDLSAQRGVDLAIAYHLETAYWLKTSRSPVPLYFLPIAEATDAEEPRIACSSTPQGEQAIAAINVLLADPAFRQDYLPAYTAWREQLVNRLPGASIPAIGQDSAP
jgi:uncharacterized protein (TIGR02285 family)